MRSFRARGNFLCGPLEAGLLRCWPDLRCLVVSENALTGTLPVRAIIEHLPRLKRLEVAQNPSLCGPMPRLFLHTLGTKLRFFDFTATGLAVVRGDDPDDDEPDAVSGPGLASPDNGKRSFSAWVEATVEAALARRGQNIDFLRARRAKRDRLAGLGSKAPKALAAAASAAAKAEAAAALVQARVARARAR